MAETVEQRRARKRDYYYKNREKMKAHSREYSRNHPEWRKEQDRKHHARYNWRKKFPERAKELAGHQSLINRFRNYDLTLDQYHAKAEQQDFLCACCNEEPQTSSTSRQRTQFDNFVIDHDHQTGRVRSLVCTNCNVALGMIRDNPETARKLTIYLETHRS